MAMHKLHSAILKDLERSTAAGMRAALYDKLRHVSRLLVLPLPELEVIDRTVLQPELPGV